MKKSLAFITLVMIYPIIKVIYYNAKFALWMNNNVIKQCDKLFYYTCGERPYENRNRN